MSRSGSAREKWTRIVREQQVSGLSIAAFCAERPIAESSVYPWRRKLGGGGDAGAAVFIEARVQSADDER